VRLLLDTQILLWIMQSDPRLSEDARSILANASEVFVSTASVWEIAIKWKLGRIKEAPQVVADCLQAAGLKELPVTNHHAAATANLPLLHRDPFDRLLVAQAICGPLRLITSDTQLAAYSELVLTI
jgi:PIN domain nuclease of toxin-antitoxin system